MFAEMNTKRGTPATLAASIRATLAAPLVWGGGSWGLAVSDGFT